MSFYKTMSFTVRSDSVETCKRAIETFLQGTRREAGTLFCYSLQDAMYPNRFLNVAAFRNAEAEHHHCASVNTRRFLRSILKYTNGLEPDCSDYLEVSARKPVHNGSYITQNAGALPAYRDVELVGAAAPEND